MKWTTASRLNAWMLMLLAVLAILPRGSLHSCGRADDHTGGTHQAAVTAACTICDEALPLSTIMEAVDPCAPSPIYLVQLLSMVCDPKLGHVLHAADRGPPALS
jgi:hypothetical protein